MAQRAARSRSGGVATAHQAQQALQQGDQVAGKRGHGGLQLGYPLRCKFRTTARFAAAAGMTATLARALQQQRVRGAVFAPLLRLEKWAARVPVRAHVWSESRRPTGAAGASGYTEG